ncbi:MAG: hypothetical protein KJO69_01045 [Gammaproteobacteria bacterium]|nr:hypothetical protein [Gammaproteobacteria bacterium]
MRADIVCKSALRHLDLYQWNGIKAVRFIKIEQYKAHMQATSLRLFFITTLFFLLTSCASRLMELDLPPSDKNISGTWVFISQDEVAYSEFKRRAQFASTRAITNLDSQNSSKRRTASKDLPNHLLMDVLVSLVSLPIQELFFEQNSNTLAVDYGVAGYHRFNMAKDNELLIGGAKIKATAGWEAEQIVIHMVITDRFQIIQRFRLLDKTNLLETLEVNMGSEQSLQHQRWYGIKAAR